MFVRQRNSKYIYIPFLSFFSCDNNQLFLLLSESFILFIVFHQWIHGPSPSRLQRTLRLPPHPYTYLQPPFNVEQVSWRTLRLDRTCLKTTSSSLSNGSGGGVP